MENETTKEDNKPSASKKENQRVESTHELYNERRKYEERRDDRTSNSGSFTSGSYSAKSKTDIVMADNERPQAPRPPLGTREGKSEDKKKRGRKSGRIVKRQKSTGKRQALRRAPKKKPRKERDLSVSTIFTRLSSLSGGARSPGCKFCGHRCCRRR